MEYFTITSEDSSVHWPHFNTQDKVVLDLGCGRWFSENYDEFSPIYFAKTAKHVIGVDSDPKEIEYFKETATPLEKFTFLHLSITSPITVSELIEEYSVNALKCDIEGYEHCLLGLTEENLRNVNEFALEYHTPELREAFLNKYTEWGFDLFGKGVFTSVGNDDMGVLLFKK